MLWTRPSWVDAFQGLIFKRTTHPGESQRWLETHTYTRTHKHTVPPPPPAPPASQDGYIFRSHTDRQWQRRLSCCGSTNHASYSFPSPRTPPPGDVRVMAFPPSTPLTLQRFALRRHRCCCWGSGSRLSELLAWGRGARVCHVGGNRFEPATYALPSSAICSFCCRRRRSLTKRRPLGTTSQRLASVNADSQTEVRGAEVNLKSKS